MSSMVTVTVFLELQGVGARQDFVVTERPRARVGALDSTQPFEVVDDLLNVCCKRLPPLANVAPDAVEESAMVGKLDGIAKEL